MVVVNVRLDADIFDNLVAESALGQSLVEELMSVEQLHEGVSGRYKALGVKLAEHYKTKPNMLAHQDHIKSILFYTLTPRQMLDHEIELKGATPAQKAARRKAMIALNQKINRVINYAFPPVKMAVSNWGRWFIFGLRLLGLKQPYRNVTTFHSHLLL